jgi:hypothetical protein
VPLPVPVRFYTCMRSILTLSGLIQQLPASLHPSPFIPVSPHRGDNTHTNFHQPRSRQNSLISLATTSSDMRPYQQQQQLLSPAALDGPPYHWQQAWGTGPASNSHMPSYYGQSPAAAGPFPPLSCDIMKSPPVVGGGPWVGDGLYHPAMGGWPTDKVPNLMYGQLSPPGRIIFSSRYYPIYFLLRCSDARSSSFDIHCCGSLSVDP